MISRWFNVTFEGVRRVSRVLRRVVHERLHHSGRQLRRQQSSSSPCLLSVGMAPSLKKNTISDASRGRKARQSGRRRAYWRRPTRSHKRRWAAVLGEMRLQRTENKSKVYLSRRKPSASKPNCHHGWLTRTCKRSSPDME